MSQRCQSIRREKGQELVEEAGHRRTVDRGRGWFMCIATHAHGPLQTKSLSELEAVFCRIFVNLPRVAIRSTARHRIPPPIDQAALLALFPTGALGLQR